MTENDRQIYLVRDVFKETPLVSTLALTKKDGGVFSYRAGQFITIYFPEAAAQGKSYSLSSAPQEPLMKITVKAIGDFSNRLCSQKTGDLLIASPPYGFFYSESETSDLVMIAGGIGITPFYSMIRHSCQQTPGRRLFLFYSSRFLNEVVFHQELLKLSEKSDHFSVRFFLTREKNVPATMINRRLTAGDILTNIADRQKSEFLICGSIAFVRDVWRDLKRNGIAEETIYTEAFFSY